MGPDMALEVFEPLERALAELEGANKILFTLLEVVVGRNRFIPLALEAKRAGFALISPLYFSSILGSRNRGRLT